MCDAKRKKPTPNFDARLIAEVNNFCPLCGKRLLGEKANRSVKLYEIVHIYPHSPTHEQTTTLQKVPKPTDPEAFENRIALCRDCHKKQDFHTTIDDYLKLYEIKQKILAESVAIDSASEVQIEMQLKDVLQKLNTVNIAELIQLSYSPVAVEQKIGRNDILLREKVKNYVVQYFPFVQDLFGQLDEEGRHRSDLIASEVKLCFQKFNAHHLLPVVVFDGLVKWLQSKTQSQHNIACEIIIAFFIQNCEVFDAIAE